MRIQGLFESKISLGYRCIGVVEGTRECLYIVERTLVDLSSVERARGAGEKFAYLGEISQSRVKAGQGGVMSRDYRTL